MRFKCKPDESLPEIGDERVIKRFLLFPKRIRNERRWLEVAYINQECVKHWALCPGGPSIETWTWRDMSWAEPPSTQVPSK